MRRFTTLLLAVAALAAPSLGRADGPAIDAQREYSPAYARCLKTGDAAKGVTVAMASCVNLEWQRQDKRLNAAYGKVMGRLSPAAKQTLRNQQRLWIKRRDTECAANPTGGTIDMIERAQCRLDMTIERAAELERMGAAGAVTEVKSEARAFAHDGGAVDLLVIGPAAKTLYDRLPGPPKPSACGATGLHKGGGRMTCVKADAEHSCHVWLNPSKQSLADAEDDDC